MTCAECQEYWQQILDGRPEAGAASFAEHMAACPACRQWNTAIRRMRDGLRLVAAPPVPSDFAQRVAERVIADQVGRQRQRRRWFASAALAASLFLAVFAGYRWINSKEPGPVSPGPVADGGKGAPEAPTPAPSPRASVTEAGEAVASLSRKATEETVEQTRLLWPVATAPLSFDGIDLQTPLDPSAQSLREAGQGVSSGLEPVANSARRAMNLFWRELPPVDSGKKQRS